MILRAVLGIVVFSLSVAKISAADAPPTTRQGEEYFETHIRPLFVEQCVRCHGPKKQEAGLRLDTSAGIAKGTDTGTILGEPSKSILLKSVRREGEYAMPPTKPLPKESVEKIAHWVTIGSPLPTDRSTTEVSGAKAAHWAFQPIANVVVPLAPAKFTNPIDRFIVAKLTPAGLTLNSPAERRTLLRRLSYDLTGLPPTFGELEAFTADTAADAYPKQVERLLATPQYGERWARHWLDLARYADTKGYVFTEDRNYPYAYAYRDYVINALNADKPYNRFVIEQLAADQLDLKGDPKPLAAMGFLTLGRRFSNNIHDILDDRIDLISRGLMGLTVSCARCHDHKFDPIPTADYYSIYGILASSHEPKDLPALETKERTAEVIAFEAELAKKEATAADFATKMYADSLAPYRTATGIETYLLAATESLNIAPGKADQFATERKLDPRVMERWRNYLRETTNDKRPAMQPWHALRDLKATEWPVKADTILKTLAAPVPKRLTTALIDAKPKSLNEVAKVYASILVEATKPAPIGQPADPERTALADVILGPNAPTNPAPMDADKLVQVATKKIFRTLRNDAAQFRAKSPQSPVRAMVLNDNPTPYDSHVFLRGTPGNRGPNVPRQMVQIVAGPNRKPFTKGSGRLELAEAIVSTDNPLTPRVLVNRIWMHHFGQGLVRTPSDFGLRSEPPTHPELLDWLARTFVTEDAWSLKALHRRIVLSETYQQSSQSPAAAAKIDPENRLLASFPRRRLDFEQLRDSLLFSAKTLELSTIGGKSVDLFIAPFTKRRSVYGFVDRQNLPGTFRAFDFASPEQHTPQRFQTTVPQQALFLMNSPFALEQATAVAQRAEVKSATTPAAKIAACYRAVLARVPTATETNLAKEFLNQAGADGMQQLAQVLLLSNELAFVD